MNAVTKEIVHIEKGDYLVMALPGEDNYELLGRIQRTYKRTYGNQDVNVNLGAAYGKVSYKPDVDDADMTTVVTTARVSAASGPRIAGVPMVHTLTVNDGHVIEPDEVRRRLEGNIIHRLGQEETADFLRAVMAISLRNVFDMDFFMKELSKDPALMRQVRSMSFILYDALRDRQV